MPTYLYETVPEHANDAPHQFELKQSMKDAPLTHHPESGLRVRRVIQSGYLNTQRWTKSSGVVTPQTAGGARCCGISGCGSH